MGCRYESRYHDHDDDHCHAITTTTSAGGGHQPQASSHVRSWLAAGKEDTGPSLAHTHAPVVVVAGLGGVGGRAFGDDGGRPPHTAAPVLTDRLIDITGEGGGSDCWGLAWRLIVWSCLVVCEDGEEQEAPGERGEARRLLHHALHHLPPPHRTHQHTHQTGRQAAAGQAGRHGRQREASLVGE